MQKLKNIISEIVNNILKEMAYTSYEKKDDILPKEILDKLKLKLGFKRFTRIGSGRFGTAFKISNTKVLKITKDLKEYEYAKKIEGQKNVHIADVYKTFHFKNHNEKEYNQYACIIKEFCNIDEHYFDNVIDSFLEYTGKQMSLSYISSEFLSGDIDKQTLNNFFKLYKDNGGKETDWMEQWYDMLMELKFKKIYVKDFNGSNVGTKPSTGKLCIIELGLGYWDKIKFEDEDELSIINENLNDYLRWKRKNITLRGMKQYGKPNEIYGSFGNGLYTVPLGNKNMAKQYGDVYYVLNAIPTNPKVVDTLNNAELWRQKLINDFCKKHDEKYNINFFHKNTTIEQEMLNMKYDGLIIKGREMVNYNPKNIKYFKTENELKNYYENIHLNKNKERP